MSKLRISNEGLLRSDIAQKLDVKLDTLRKAINDGRLQELEKPTKVTVKSSRTEIDAAESDRLGTACTRVEERTLAAFGAIQGVPVHFEACMDVPKGGVLTSLPALLANGLMKGVHSFETKITGYYTAFHVLLLLALMALCRIKTVERIRGESAGEFGKLMGLDRIPEVRCLRMISTEYQLDHTRLGARMFSRWCQENFFRYMMEHFAIDLLQEYGTQDLLPKR
ncbi:putative transposase [uncultured Desulfobacter sp.]|uniref:putative transposase n=1 Tax=uncultured Desulfobacter sp. TaxID=240139 RepID=UPI0029F47D26|nr:hypothetical protein [uncultured Desulfobacter sp.]